MRNIAIVAVGYNRPDCSKRLLESLGRAEYGNEIVDLIVSIDKGQKQLEIKEIADDFLWNHGQKIVIAHKERKGLKQHILSCGEMTKKYEAVIVLEDDITVSRSFFYYTINALDYYKDNDEIAGISLYGFLFNPGVRRPFLPEKNEYDTYLMQVAQSWGQVWTRGMWESFFEWFSSHQDGIPDDGITPSYISKWGEGSWLKYYDRYVAETNKFYVYPYTSLSTNNSDVGEHCKYANNSYQVPLQAGIKKEYLFAPIEKAVKYDAFFERIGLIFKIYDIESNEILMDLMGGRTNYLEYNYLLSINLLPYKCISSYRLCFRPIEVNCKNPTEGKDYFLYDLHEKATPPHNSMYGVTSYDIKDIHWKKTILHGMIGLWISIKRRLGIVK